MAESVEIEGTGGCGPGEVVEEEEEGRETAAALRAEEGWRAIGPEGAVLADAGLGVGGFGLGVGAAVDAGVRAGEVETGVGEEVGA